MTTTEVKYIVTEIDAVMKMHHLKDALPRLNELKRFCVDMYRDMKEEEREILAEEQSASQDSEPHTSDEEFLANDDSIDYPSESSSQEVEEVKSSDSELSSSESDCECEEGCTCEACIHC